MRFIALIRKLLHPTTGVYILFGIIIMFLTFFTDDNALEIAISGIASIFIGIGVNNFTQLDSSEKNVVPGIKEITIAIKTLQYTKEKLNNTVLLFDENISLTSAKNQLTELQSFIDLSIQQLQYDIEITA